MLNHVVNFPLYHFTRNAVRISKIPYSLTPVHHSFPKYILNTAKSYGIAKMSTVQISNIKENFHRKC